MSKYFILILCICLSKTGFSQDADTPVYKRFPVVPTFTIIKAPDSAKFTNLNLKKKKPTIIIVFSPDCEHCQHETKELLANINLFKKVQIVMASSLDYGLIKKFYDEYKIADYPNIIMGKDPTYYFGTFFRVRYFPAIYLYDKKGNFVKEFDGNVPVQQIADAL